MKQTLKYILTQVIDSLKFAESKHAVTIALNGAIIVFTIGYLSYNNIIIVILNWLIVFFCGVSIILSFLAIMSRQISFFNKAKKPKKLNLLYFKHLSTFNEEELVKTVVKNYNFPNDYHIDGFDLDLAKQIIANSKIALTKFNLFNKSIFCLIFAIIVMLIMFALVGLGV